MVSVIFLGTYRLKSRAEKRYTKDSYDVKLDVMEGFVTRYLRRKGTKYEKIEDYGENTGKEYAFNIEEFEDLTFTTSKEQGYKDYSPENESNTNFIGRVGTHESTHALTEAGVWKDPTPQDKEKYPQRREEMWRSDRGN